MEFVAFDLEANNDASSVEEHEIVEIGAVRWRDGAVIDRWSTLVRPARPLTRSFVELTGIDQSMLNDAADVANAVAQLIDFAGTGPVFAHNGAGYDFPLLNHTSHRLGMPPPTWVEIDSLEIAHLVFGRSGGNLPRSVDGTIPPSSRSLQYMARAYAVPFSGPAHRASADAEVCAAVVARMIGELNRDTPVRLLQRWLLAVGGHPISPLLTSAPAQPPELEEVIPPPEKLERRRPTGAYDPAAAADSLGPAGDLIHRHREYRPQQHQMAAIVADALADPENTPVLVEAPTGTGKTLAYLIPSIAWARASGATIGVAAHTRVLQNQIITTLEELGREDGVDVNWALLKGRANYLDVEALADLVEGVSEDPGVAFALALVAGWASETPTGDWDDLATAALESRIPELAYLRWTLSVRGEPGPAESELDTRCFYRRAMERLRLADIAVLNHALVISNDDATASLRHLVLDEAHNLEDTATAALSDEVSETSARTLLDAVWDRRHRRGVVERYARWSSMARDDPRLAVIEGHIAEMSRSLDSLGDALTTYVRSRSGSSRRDAETYGISHRVRVGVDTAAPAYQSTVHAARRTRDSMRELARVVGEMEIPAEIPRRQRRRLERGIAAVGRELFETAETLDATVWGTGRDEWVSIIDVSPVGEGWSWILRRAPVSVAPWLRDLWQAMDTVVLTSATLRGADNFSYVIRALGIEQASPYPLGTPFANLAQNHRVILTDHLPAPRPGLMDEFIAAETREIPRMLLASNGRGLVLFTAWRRLDKVKDAARSTLRRQGLEVLAQGEAPAVSLTDAMRTSTTSSLLAVRSFWEGIDVPGEALSLLIIEKIPFESPGDPIVSARMEEMELRGQDPFASYLVPRAALRFAQGVGRLIRSDTDIGVTVVLDSRLRRPTPYRDRILSSLPGPPSFSRPGTAEDSYRQIADHLDVPWTDELASLIDAVDSNDAWSSLAALQLSEHEIRDPLVVENRLDQARELFGFDSWRPGQLETMVRFLQGEDVLAVLPTGFGKSITFQIPALIGTGTTLVVSPLVALMRDQVQALRDRGLRSIAAIHSGQPVAEQKDILRTARTGGLKLLYVSPERLWSPIFRAAIGSIDVTRVAVDEAHCISQWGHTFRPEYTAIPEALRLLHPTADRPPLLAATATATPRTRREILDLLGMSLQNEAVVASPDRPELRYFVEPCADNSDRDRAILRIAEAFRGATAIVYVPSPRQSARVTALLRNSGHNVRAYHGRMDPEQRLYVEDAFRYGEIDIVVATKAFGLGIDKPDIALIVHFEMPASIEEFIQETGRAARGAVAGTGPPNGVSVLLVTPRDCAIHRWFTRQAAPKPEAVRALWRHLAAGDNFICPDDLPTPLNEQFDGPDEVTLAIHYLAKAGSVTRLGDIAWQGRLWIPDGELSLDVPENLRDSFEAVVSTADLLGTMEFDALRWAKELGEQPDQVTQQLLELEAADLVGFVAWRYALHLKRTDLEPDWEQIAEWGTQRKQFVGRLSEEARQYSRSSGCRRKPLLQYLGFDCQVPCGGCDQCTDLPRPWKDIEVSLDDVNSAVLAKRAVLWLVNDAQHRRHSERNLARTLIGDGEGQYELAQELQSHSTFAALAGHSVSQVIEEFEQLVVAGLLRRTNVKTHSYAPYQSLELTEAGRSLIR